MRMIFSISIKDMKSQRIQYSSSSVGKQSQLKLTKMTSKSGLSSYDRRSLAAQSWAKKIDNPLAHFESIRKFRVVRKAFIVNKICFAHSESFQAILHSQNKTLGRREMMIANQPALLDRVCEVLKRVYHCILKFQLSFQVRLYRKTGLKNDKMDKK